MRVVTAAFAIAAGLIVLLGYFFPEQLGSLRLLLLDWAVIIAGMAVLVGIFNLAAVQMEKFRARQKGGTYGLLLVVVGRTRNCQHAFCSRCNYRTRGSLAHGDPRGDIDLCQHSSPAPPGRCDERCLPDRYRDLPGLDYANAFWSSFGRPRESGYD